MPFLVRNVELVGPGLRLVHHEAESMAGALGFAVGWMSMRPHHPHGLEIAEVANDGTEIVRWTYDPADEHFREQVRQARRVPGAPVPAYLH